MARIIDVQTGQVALAANGAQLVSAAIGSCVAVVAYERKKKMGGIAHVMLPGKAPRNDGTGRPVEPLRYAANAIGELLRRFRKAGGSTKDISICIAGGGNVLERPDDSICECNIASVHEVIEQHGMVVLAQSVGGNRRRRVRLDLDTGKLYCAEGDGRERVMCECGKTRAAE
ncbi:MAG: hypothetical protein GF418_10840 [Chitinivibrionales bacterium]|nr:hypothetical protein [Chitinivibrionales bacterium]MBD3396111.1 hypothetical protein [Chitinivibrionales bacterium]